MSSLSAYGQHLFQLQLEDVQANRHQWKYELNQERTLLRIRKGFHAFEIKNSSYPKAEVRLSSDSLIQLVHTDSSSLIFEITEKQGFLSKNMTVSIRNLTTNAFAALRFQKTTIDCDILNGHKREWFTPLFDDQRLIQGHSTPDITCAVQSQCILELRETEIKRMHDVKMAKEMAQRDFERSQLRIQSMQNRFLSVADSLMTYQFGDSVFNQYFSRIAAYSLCEGSSASVIRTLSNDTTCLLAFFKYKYHNPINGATFFVEFGSDLKGEPLTAKPIFEHPPLSSASLHFVPTTYIRDSVDKLYPKIAFVKEKGEIWVQCVFVGKYPKGESTNKDSHDQSSLPWQPGYMYLVVQEEYNPLTEPVKAKDTSKPPHDVLARNQKLTIYFEASTGRMFGAFLMPCSLEE